MKRNCMECGREFDSKNYYRYCDSCRSLYGVEQRQEYIRRDEHGTKGRDIFSERLRTGFRMMGCEEE